LWHAAKAGHTETTIALLDAKADANMMDMADQETALHWATRAGDLALIEQLLQAGANADALNRRGYTPLHFAGNASTVRMLLLAGKALEERPIRIENVTDWAAGNSWAQGTSAAGTFQEVVAAVAADLRQGQRWLACRQRLAWASAVHARLAGSGHLVGSGSVKACDGDSRAAARGLWLLGRRAYDLLGVVGGLVPVAAGIPPCRRFEWPCKTFGTPTAQAAPEAGVATAAGLQLASWLRDDLVPCECCLGVFEADAFLTHKHECTRG
jgi:hypothetical protein